MQAERGLSTARAIPCAACIVDRTFPGCCFALKRKEWIILHILALFIISLQGAFCHIGYQWREFYSSVDGGLYEKKRHAAQSHAPDRTLSTPAPRPVSERCVERHRVRPGYGADDSSDE